VFTPEPDPVADDLSVTAGAAAGHAPEPPEEAQAVEASAAHATSGPVFPSAPVLDVAVPDVGGGGVGLGFADGQSVQLSLDDPRVRTFRAAAAALLEPPRT
jgi:hypothetical protein